MVLAARLCGHSVVFPRRVVTRVPSEAEQSEALSPPEFERQRIAGAFAFWWQAHGLSYGLRCDIDDDLRDGRTVAINVSRAMVRSLRQRYRHIVVVQITAPQDVLAERLARRARASDGSLQERMSRAASAVDLDPDITILNVGAAEDHARELASAIQSALRANLR